MWPAVVAHHYLSLESFEDAHNGHVVLLSQFTLSKCSMCKTSCLCRIQSLHCSHGAEPYIMTGSNWDEIGH